MVVNAPLPARATISFEQAGFYEEVVADHLPFATALAFDRDGRIFIALKAGIVRVWENGSLLPEPFLDISTQVNDVFDRGLLGIALHPDFPTQPYVYLLFTRDPPGVVPDAAGSRAARLIRVEADPQTNFTTALPGMESAQNPSCLAAPPPSGCPGHVVLLGRNSLRPFLGNEIDGRDTTRASCMAGGTMGVLPLVLPSDDPNLPYPEGTSRPIEDCSPVDERTHTIGTVAFGPRGELFVSAGDGANFNVVDPRALRSLMLDSLAGKVLRIDAETGDGLPDNPFFDPACPGCNRSKVWARGLRNPFRFAIDPASGEPVIGDVGWNTWEEIDRGRGANFGWPCYEGAPHEGLEGVDTFSAPQPAYAANSATAFACAQLYAAGTDAVRAPVFAYSHEGDGYGGSGGASANAGAFYSGTAYPAEFRGALFLLDYNRRWIRTLRFDEDGNATIGNFGRESHSGMVQIVNGPEGDLYVVVFAGNGGEVRRIRYEAGGNTPPVAVAEADPVAGDVPLTVRFHGSGSFDRDGQGLSFAWDFADGATSSEADPQHVYVKAGTYGAKLTVTETTAPFAIATTTVTVVAGTTPPTATILEPDDGEMYRIGDRIAFRGGGTIDGQPAGPADLSWELRLHHNEHVHFTSLGSGVTGSLLVDEHGDATFLEICLSVAPSVTLSATDCVQLFPEPGEIRVFSEPSGMAVVYEDEGTLLTTPATAVSIVGSAQRLTVPFVQQFRTFAGWSDGVLDPSREVVVGPEPVAVTALFENRAPHAVAGVVAEGSVAPVRIRVTAAASADPEAGPLRYRWSFAGECRARTSRAEHVFAQPGSYDVVLRVEDPLGAIDEATARVEVAARECACDAGEADSDRDGVCDRYDACDAMVRVEDLRVAARKGKLGRRRSVSIAGAYRPVEEGDPSVSGVQLAFRDACGAVLLQIEIPGGDGWRPAHRGWVWRGMHPQLGRTRVVLQYAAADPERIRVRLQSRGGAIEFGEGALPASLRLAIGSAAGACAEASLTACRFVHADDALRCTNRQ